jgi:hypothetical protein
LGYSRTVRETKEANFGLTIRTFSFPPDKQTAYNCSAVFSVLASSAKRYEIALAAGSFCTISVPPTM